MKEYVVSDFSGYISLQLIKGKWGICLNFENDIFLGYPISLSESLYVKENDTLYFNWEHDFNKILEVDIKNDYKSIKWRIIWDNPVILCFDRLAFTNYIIQLLDELIEKIKADAGIWYDTDYINIQSVSLLKQQLKEFTFPFNTMICVLPVKLEKVSLLPKNDDEFHEEMLFKIGNRTLNFWDEFYGSDLERLRHNLESFTFNNEATLKFAEDCEDNILNIKTYSFLKSKVLKNGGIFFDYWDTVKIGFYPFYNKKPILMGISERIPTIKNIYEGLLLRALSFPLKHEEGEDWPERIIAYNILKSPIIEKYLMGKYKDNFNIEKRQQNIDRVIMIDPDYDVCFWDQLSDNAPFGISEDKIEDNDISSDGLGVVLEGYSEWSKEMSVIVEKSAIGHPYTVDWIDFHQRGLDLAHRLRKRMPTNIDLWYSAPYEDNSGIIPHPLLIIEDFEDKIIQHYGN